MLYLPLSDGKICRVCHQWIPIGDLVKEKGAPLNRATICKPCNAPRARKHSETYRTKHPEKVRNSASRYRENNRAKINAASSARYHANPEAGKQKHRDYYARDPQRARNKTQRWRDKNREIIQAKDRDKYWRNPDRARARARDYRIRNPERTKQYNDYYQLHHKDRKIACTLRWNKANPDSRKNAHRRLRAKRANAPGKHTTNDVKMQFKRQKGKCYYCNRKVGDKWHVEHVVPLSRGGSDNPDNIVIACPDCNMHKGNKMPHEWGEGGRLL